MVTGSGVQELLNISKNIRIFVSRPTSSTAVLQQRAQNGDLKPVVFASRSLTMTERNYAQIEREALAIIYGVQKFRQYLLGRTFTLLTDHQPLVKLFGEHSRIPQLAAARIKRWATILSAYSYKVKYISSKENVCADYLSRAPIQEKPTADEVQQDDVMLIDVKLSEIPLTAKTVATETNKDPCLSKVLHLSTYKGGLARPKPFFTRKNELSVEQGCLLWGNLVVIPTTLRSNILLDLHSEHLGIVRMKSLARQHFWWPKLDAAIGEVIE
ncbi:hypothetical protein QZH41_004724 [Actinostola sp. cb2023]|nr:hypothetical protein QZH41_004724 [Actinostola sp. cb2023]